MTASIESLPTNCAAGDMPVAKEYPTRVAHGTEAIARDLQAAAPDCRILTVNGCLVAPLVRPGVLRAINHQTSQSEQIVERLRRAAFTAPIDANLGNAYYAIHSGQMNTDEHAHVRVSVNRDNIREMYKENELVNACLHQWQLGHRGLNTVMLLTRDAVPAAQAHMLACVIDNVVGTQVTLGAPIVASIEG